jgi:hypothetical protein
MRPGQKNRMRGGRGNNNGSRRGPNPLTRSYESNGPDVKVRGTPQHIAEKYVQLARDAHTASDTVMAESYLQHAEHYYRIIAAAQNVQLQAYNQANGIPNTEQEQVEDEDEFEVAGADRFTFRAPQNFQQPGGFNGQTGGYGQQPYQPGQGFPGQGFGNDLGGSDQPAMADAQPPMAEGGQPQYQPQPRGDRPPFNNRRYEERGDRQERPDRQGSPERQERPERQDGRAEGRPDSRNDRGPRRFGRDRPDRPFGGDRNAAERPPGDRPQNDRPQTDRPAGERSGFQARTEFAATDAVADEQPVLPSFITAPVRVMPAPEAGVPGAGADEAAVESGIRPRRRRPRVAKAAESEGGEE